MKYSLCKFHTSFRLTRDFLLQRRSNTNMCSFGIQRVSEYEQKKQEGSRLSRLSGSNPAADSVDALDDPSTVFCEEVLI